MGSEGWLASRSSRDRHGRSALAKAPADNLRLNRERRLVPEVGIEPTLPEGNGILSPVKWVSRGGRNRSERTGECAEVIPSDRVEGKLSHLGAQLY